MVSFSRQDYERLLEAGKRYFSTAFPNPDRVGCPGQDILKAIAFRRLDRETARQWDNHMSHCSPCFNEYMAFREEARRSARFRALAAVAAAIILIVIAGWLGLRNAGVNRQAWQEATLDLRSHEPLRGPQRGNPAPPLVLPRRRLALTIDLPVGSEVGKYYMQVVQGASKTVGTASGVAELVDGVTVLKVRVDLREASVGPSSFLVRRSSQNWGPYTVSLK